MPEYIIQWIKDPITSIWTDRKIPIIKPTILDEVPQDINWGQLRTKILNVKKEKKELDHSSKWF